MDATPPKTLRGRLKSLECRLDAWAAGKLSPDEYADAQALDRRLKQNFWSWLGKFALIVAFFGLIAQSLWPHLGFGRAMLYSGIVCTYLLVALVSAWYGWRKYTRKPAWKVFLFFMFLLVAGAATGYVIGNYHMGRSLTQVDPEKGARAIAIAVLLGTVLGGLLVGVAHLRLREANQKAARLQAEAERERLARQGTQAELKLLQAQVEPHFLFNTLANVRHLVQTGSPDALAMLDHLIKYLRTALPEIRSEGSTVGREAELARAYLEIMRLRMGGALEISIDIPPGLEHRAFPPLMVITLVENAIKHGVAPMGRGKVAVRAIESGGRVRVEVEDDGRGIGGEIGQGLGLANLRERLRALYGESARLDLSGRVPSGASAVIEVPA